MVHLQNYSHNNVELVRLHECFRFFDQGMRWCFLLRLLPFPGRQVWVSMYVFVRAYVAYLQITSCLLLSPYFLISLHYQKKEKNLSFLRWVNRFSLRCCERDFSSLIRYFPFFFSVTRSLSLSLLLNNIQIHFFLFIGGQKKSKKEEKNLFNTHTRKKDTQVSMMQHIINNRKERGS